MKGICKAQSTKRLWNGTPRLVGMWHTPILLQIVAGWDSQRRAGCTELWLAEKIDKMTQGALDCWLSCQTPGVGYSASNYSRGSLQRAQRMLNNVGPPHKCSQSKGWGGWNVVMLARHTVWGLFGAQSGVRSEAK